MTSSNAASFGSIADGRGGGDTMCPGDLLLEAVRRDTAATPVRHS